MTQPKITEEAKAKRLEFSPDHKGRFDEITARFADGMVHVETMSKTGCYVGFYWDDGTYCQWWISSDKKLGYHHESGKGGPPKYDAWGRPNALILPDPKDPLDQVWDEFWPSSQHNKELFRQALAKRGGKITFE